MSTNENHPTQSQPVQQAPVQTDNAPVQQAVQQPPQQAPVQPQVTQVTIQQSQETAEPDTQQPRMVAPQPPLHNIAEPTPVVPVPTAPVPDSAIPEIKEEAAPVKNTVVDVVIDETYSTPKELEGTVKDRLNMPPAIQEVILNSVADADVEVLDSDGEDWKDSNIGAYYNSLPDATFVDRLYSGKWRNSIPTDTKAIKMSSMSAKSGANKKLSGKEARYRLMDSLGIGRIGEVPLVHTGIWVKFTPPKEEAITNYYREIGKEKAELGRYTFGKIFSNMGILHIDTTLRFVLKHVVATSLEVQPTDIKKLLDIIAPEDIPILQWGLAKAMYPEGVEYDVGCVADPQNCKFLFEGILAVDKLHFMDIDAIPKSCMDTLKLSGNGSVSESDVVAYKERLWADQESVFEVATLGGAPLKVTLQHHSISSQIIKGKEWIKACHHDIVNVLGEEADEDTRNNYVVSKAKISYARQYEHYVKSIDTGNGIIEGDSLPEALVTISSSDVTRESLLKAIHKFIETGQHSVIGIPNYVCPTCKKSKELEGETLISSIVPLDVTQVFFTIIGIKMVKIMERVL